MKKLLLLLLIPIYMFGLVINKDVVDNYIKKEQVILDYIITYLYKQDKLPTKTDLTSYFNLNDDIYTNIYNDGKIDFTTNSDGITLKDIISITPSYVIIQQLLQLYQRFNISNIF